MKNNHKSILFLITFVFILSLCMLNTEQTFLSSNSNINMKSDYQNLNLNEVEYSNATVIADNDYCRKPFSTSPDIAVDNLGGIHVVGEYSFTISGGKVYCIRYVNYTGTKVMSCKTFNLNTNSYSPNIAVDDFGGIHVVCSSSPYGIWGSDREIRYINYNRTIGWISAIVISDGYNGTYWNDGSSTNPNIAVDDLGGIHVVWEDDTDGVWGNDTEIMYTTYTEATGWLN
ncbi:MAG: hypothetical protein HWN81_21425, partial [Candidatus Lokiarchaeota archaeon]|nr:hypothetical protein [Candidatus Lokiarchaeota archaeon]